MSEFKGFNQDDLQRINEFLMKKEIERRTSQQSLGWLVAMLFILAAVSAYNIPENFLGFENANGWAALFFIGIAVVAIFLSKLSNMGHQGPFKGH